MVTIDRLTTGYVGLSTDEKPTGCRNGDTFIEMDTCTLYAYDEAGHQWLKQSGSDGGSSDGGDDAVIYDGQIEIEYSEESAKGIFIPITEPVDGKNILIDFDGQIISAEYQTSGAFSNGWTDRGQLIAVFHYEGNWNLAVFSPTLLPSMDFPQTVTVKITQDLSGGSSDESITMPHELPQQT